MMLLFLAAFFLSEQNFIFYKAGGSYLSDCTTLLLEGSSETVRRVRCESWLRELRRRWRVVSGTLKTEWRIVLWKRLWLNNLTKRCQFYRDPRPLGLFLCFSPYETLLVYMSWFFQPCCEVFVSFCTVFFGLLSSLYSPFPPKQPINLSTKVIRRLPRPKAENQCKL